MRVLVLMGLILGAPAGAHAQAIPEGVYQRTDGPADICGLKAPDAPGIMEQARLSPDFHPRDIGSDRFELFETRPIERQLVITRPGEPAHPAVSCRSLVRDDHGGMRMVRSLRCDASKEACDALFWEFRALDERALQSIRSGG